MRRAFVPRIVPVLLVALLVACGASTRTKALRLNLAALNGTRDTVRAASKEREVQIIEHAASKEEGRAQLDAWRATIDKVTAAIDDGYDAIWAASIFDDVKSVSDAGAAVAKALELVKTIKNPTTPPKNATTAKETKP